MTNTFLQYWAQVTPRPHLQDLDIGLMRIRHLHPVDLDEAERWDLVHVGGVLQAAHHLVDSGRLPCPRHTRDVHTPETGAATRQVSGPILTY